MFDEDGAYVRTYYVNRRLDLPPAVAQAALLAIEAHDRINGPHASSGLTFTGALLLRDGWILATRPGRIHSGPHRLTVELELTPWSSQRTELGIRPMRSLWTTWPTRSCLQVAVAALDALGEQMSAWADEPLREVLAFPRSRPATHLAAAS
jgi:hypothetical protein